MNIDFYAEFLPYLALAFILFALRETKKVSNAWIPLIALGLGILYAAWEAGGFTPPAFLNGCQYALLGVGSVATIKYFLESHKPYKK